MSNKITILSTIIILALFTQIVSADLIDIGEKGVSWRYEISNIGDYPDYVFMYYEERSFGHGIINPGDRFYFYKNSLASICTIKKTEFNEEEFNALEDRNYTEVKDYFTNNPDLIKSGIQLRAYGLVQQNDPLEKAVITLDIVSLTETNLDIQKSKITYTYEDGTSEEKVFQNQDVFPEPSKQAILPWWFAEFWYVTLPATAIAIIGAILLLRKLRK